RPRSGPRAGARRAECLRARGGHGRLWAPGRAELPGRRGPRMMDLDLRKLPAWLVVVLAGVAVLPGPGVFLFPALCLGPVNAAVGVWMVTLVTAGEWKRRRPRRRLLH